MRIIFMGTPAFAVESLKVLHQSNHAVVAVITAIDKPAGRGRKLNQSAVKEYALSENLNILQPNNLKDEGFLEQVKAFNADMFVVVAFRMLPKVLWSLPKYGTFNLHSSLLPDYRGAAPINWVIVNGETKTGVTTFFINEDIDTGEILLQEETQIGADEDAGALHDRLMAIGAGLVMY
jgi:methionyl-tRNA formyltransferase